MLWQGDIMKRKIYNHLLEWKNSEDRKPLVLQGARQVGKTYIVNLFGSKEYANVVYCNFEREKGLANFFSDLIPQNIIKKISNYKRKEVLPEYTLIEVKSSDNTRSRSLSIYTE